MIYTFSEITDSIAAGGKGRSLAKMKQEGLLVPDGLVVTSEAFEGNKLRSQFHTLLHQKLSKLEKKGKRLFAVRSSGDAEDSSAHSFAGEYESLLNIEEEQLTTAIEEVYDSRNNERVQSYGENLGIEEKGSMAVVVQSMIQPRYSGVIFSADPVSRRFEYMIGNAVAGMGESLVSGEADSLDFKLSRDKGGYEGPSLLKKAARKLFENVHAIEKIFACPVDVEWAWDGKRLYILQARPVSTLTPYDKNTGGLNDSLTGSMLWSNANVAEAVPDVMTPSSWSLMKVFHESGPIPFVRIVPGAANICGRPYINVSYMISIFKALGKDYKNTGKDVFFGTLPENLEIPLFPQRKKDLLPKIIKAQFTTIPLYKKMQKDIPSYLEENPPLIESLKEKVEMLENTDQWIELWNRDIFPHFVQSCKFLRVATILFGDKLSVLRKKIQKIVPDDVTNDILSNLGGSSSSLVSLKLVRGVYGIQRGSMTREEFIKSAGFRGPHEFELSIPDMQEDPALLEPYLSSPIEKDPEKMLTEQKKRSAQAWAVLEEKDPKAAQKLKANLERISFMADRRERVREEMIRVIRFIRTSYLKAGRLSGWGEDLFFLSYEELIDALVSGILDEKLIKSRKEAHRIYCEIPYYPPLIKGVFDPQKWWNDPGKRMDISDDEDLDLNGEDFALKGHPASCGTVEGTVRVVLEPEKARELIEGEILVAATTNVGWTPYFLKVAGVVTDVGAPLSHAAIVARELGIPAIVGCGHATSLLKTGDRILMNGSDGTITILEEVQ